MIDASEIRKDIDDKKLIGKEPVVEVPSRTQKMVACLLETEEGEF